MISFEAVTLRRGSRVLFEDASFALHDGQHAGLTGANGCGKSSLFALLLGELGVDAGEVRVPAGLRIAHMAQEVEYTDRAALDYVIDGDRELDPQVMRTDFFRLPEDRAVIHAIALVLDGDLLSFIEAFLLARGAPSASAEAHA